jgi:malonyl-CoA/methylmalonyl-CoA synthetase
VVAVGAVFLPLNTGYTAAEVDYFRHDAAPGLFFDDAGLAALSGDAADFVPCDCGGDDLAAILYTSGTTGRSKGAMLTHHNLLSNAQVLVEAWQFTDTDVLLHALPIFHTHGLFVACNVSFLSGGAMIFLPSFDVKTVLALMPRATVMMGVPTFYTRLLEQTDLDFAHMRLFTSGSAPLLAQTHRDFAARTGQVILERYGMTETNMNTSNPYDGERRSGTVGKPLGGVGVRLSDVVDGVGMIEVVGPNVFAGYWQMLEKTAAEFTADGWFITGDLGSLDADGYLSIVGRSKDLVITGGYNVYPKEVEMVLRTRVLKRIRRLLLSMVPGLVLFTAWDAYAISQGHWFFDLEKILGWQVIAGVPIDEVLFFIVVPLAAILTLEAVRAVWNWPVGDEDAS